MTRPTDCDRRPAHRTCRSQARDLLRIASEIRIPKVVLVGDAKQLDAVDAGKPFAQLQQAGMKTAVMDERIEHPAAGELR